MIGLRKTREGNTRTRRGKERKGKERREREAEEGVQACCSLTLQCEIILSLK